MLAAATVCIAASKPVTFVDYAGDFDRIEAQTRALPAEQRVAVFRAAFARIRPGLYADKDAQALDGRIASALSDFPEIRESYLSVERGFSTALNAAVVRFRRIVPSFVPPIPIVLAHELGVRDGGSDYVDGQKVMLFGADVIARFHDDDSLQPFLEHELFHLEHARHFADCDQLWCLMWQEGLATDAARLMTPNASDHQLLLDRPGPIRASTDRRWPEALCFVSSHFDQTDTTKIGEAFLGNRHPPDMPARFGYYVGLRVAQEAERSMPLSQLARLDDLSARPIVAKALADLMLDARATCAVPARSAPITHAASRPP